MYYALSYPYLNNLSCGKNSKISKVSSFKFTEAKRAKEIEEEELRRQEQAAKDQADAGSPNEETGKIFALNPSIFDPEILRFIIENFNIKCKPSKLFIIPEKILNQNSISFFTFLTRCLINKKNNNNNFPKFQLKNLQI